MHDTLTSLRQRLKQATTDQHLTVERLVGPLHTQNEYNEYVRAMHAFRFGAEEWLAQHAHSTPGWQPHKLAPALTLDVSDLALKPLENAFGVWREANSSFAMGVHYVLEGSALGARILCKRVEALGLTREHGARHLWAQADRSDNFRSYLDALNAGARDFDEDELVAGANAAFGAAAYAMDCAANG